MQENKSPYQVGDLVKLRDPPTDHPDQKFLKCYGYVESTIGTHVVVRWLNYPIDPPVGKKHISTLETDRDIEMASKIKR